MCGIFGFAKLKQNAIAPASLRHAIRYLALRNQSRGTDSTGLACVYANNDTFDVRKVCKAEAFLDSAPVASFIESHLIRDTKLALGHTRAATTGAVIKVNAQPFNVGSITGTHNGIIRNYAELFSAHALQPATSCDSEVIFALLNACSGLPDSAARLSELEGYFALAWHDQRDPDALFLARSSGSLYAARDKNARFLFWSSERDVLEALFRILGSAPELIDVPFDSILRLSLSGAEAQLQRIPQSRIITGYGSGYGSDGSCRGAIARTFQRPSNFRSPAPGEIQRPASASELQFNRRFRKRFARMLQHGGLPGVYRTGFCDGCGGHSYAARCIQQFLLCYPCEELLIAAVRPKDSAAPKPAADSFHSGAFDTLPEDGQYPMEHLGY